MARIEPELQRLQEIKTLPSLLKYLKDDLNWPIGSDATEDVTFDYDPAELGFDTASTANIEEVRQLRPLTAGQKWGIFWVKFGKKQLPVQMLRRALGNLVVKKRASTKKTDKAAWQMHDLLFISAYGDDSNRHITFAHFSQEEDSENSLPVLKVLGWDDDDTLLHLKHTYKTLVSSLDWDKTDTTDPDAWRKQWSSAFTLGHREVINTTKELVEQLAKLATVIKKSVLTSIKAETEKGPWRKLMLAFQKTLIKDLDEDQFADVIAQTISYGLLTARLSSDGQISLKNLVDMVPSTNPFLKELLQHFLTSAGMKGLFDVDEAGINDVVELLNHANAQAIRNDFGKKTDGEDPVIHFYEHFLGAYNKKLKVERGVFYTPQPIVSYIVRSVHELLQKEFGLEDGLADTSTWAEVKSKNNSLKLPEGIKDPKIEPFVQILDPATGTATFLIEVIDVIHATMIAKWNKERISKADQIKKWNTYVPTHLLPRLYAYELMMAPYAIAHMKVGLKLNETGFTAWEILGPENRANIFLTNALEPWEKQLNLIGFDALAHEAAAVNEIKRQKHFTVIIGNPPYSGISANMSDAIVDLVEPYKKINGVTLGERKIWVQDDYKKFIRFSQLKLETTCCGVLGFITNHGFINEPTSRGMRHNLLGTFPRVTVLDLHGSLKKREACPDGSPDRNVFDIEPGVAISFFRSGGREGAGVVHGELWGLREAKYDWLLRNTVGTTKWAAASPSPEFYLFIPQNDDTRAEFSHFLSITDIFESGSNGIQTSRDHVVYGFRQAECRSVIEDFRLEETSLSTKELREKYWPGKKVANYAPGDTRGWRVQEARKDLRQDTEWEAKFRRALYRPFDFQMLFYADYMIDWPRTEVMSQMLRPNLSLCVGRAGSAADNQEWNITFVANTLVDMNLFYRGGNVSYPLRFAPVPDGLDFDCKPRPNFKGTFLNDLSRTLGLPQTRDFDLPASVTPEDIFHYVYAVFHSPGYRSRYAEFLKIDFPRLPLTGSLELFRTLARLGAELTALHLLESPRLDQPITEFIGSRNTEVDKVSWSRDTVWMDKAQTSGIRGVREPVWEFHIGGYQVCEKWLKDRKGRKLTKEDIEHYRKIVVAISETIRLMAEIDKVIDEHGGWPSAFQSGKK